MSWSVEASENFADRITNMKDWYVRITPQEGESFDAVLVAGGTYGAGEKDPELGWYDAVRYVPADPETGLAVEGAAPRVVRVKSVHVY